MKPGGVVEIFGPYGTEELHSSTCAHCQYVSIFPSRREMHKHVDVCRGCMKLICAKCAGQGCQPFERKLEEMEARGRLLRDMGIT